MDLKIFAKTIEPKARAQIDLLLAQKPFKDCKVRIMPDVHAGVGCVIGFTANLGDKVIPNIVGVDIGCGMLTVGLGKRDIDFEKLDQVIRRYVPSGRCVHPTPRFGPSLSIIDGLRCKAQLRDVEWLHCSVGTLGGGNHFIEIDEDSDGNKYLIIHTGSRNLGKQVAEIYQAKAVKSCHSQRELRYQIIKHLRGEGREKEISTWLAKLDAKKRIPKELCYLEGNERDDYLHDMRLCQHFAHFNREAIASAILYYMDGPCTSHLWFHTVHNYIDDQGMVRKGAISARWEEQVLIPINMRDGCLLGTGLGNPDWNYSAPHGAGRIMSRSKAKESIPLEEYRKAMEGVFTTSVSPATLDEAPQAYKPIDEILECIGETVKVNRIIWPVYNFKAGD